MRLHALILTLFVLGAHAASIPDKKDIEKKLAEVVKEVLNKDDVPIENASSEQELIEQTDVVKDVENNLRKTAQITDIPVKVVVEDVKTVLKTDDRKEDNEVLPASGESSEIVREEIDLKNPGPPQHMQHDNQNPEHFEDAQQAIVLKNSEWRDSQQYLVLQTEMKQLKENFENKMSEVLGSIQEHWNTHPVKVDEQQKEEENIKVRSSVRQDASSASSSSGGEGGGSAASAASGSGGSGNANSTSQGNNPFSGIFASWAQNFQQSLQNMNQTINNYWNNSTNSNSSNSNQCSGGGGSGTNVFNWGSNNPLNLGGQSQTQQQSDEPARPGLWQSVQNFFQGGNPPPPPAGAQSDTPQPAQPVRPVFNAIQQAINSASNIFPRPQTGQAAAPQPQQPSQQITEAGTNVVPVDSKPESEKEKEKPEQATLPPQQSGPIKQMIGNNAVVQGIAGAVQRIQHTIMPNRPREDVKDAGNKDAQATKGGWYSSRPGQPSGDNNGSTGNRVEEKSAEEQKIIAEETPEAEVPAKGPTEEEKTEQVQEKTE